MSSSFRIIDTTNERCFAEPLAPPVRTCFVHTRSAATSQTNFMRALSVRALALIFAVALLLGGAHAALFSTDLAYGDVRKTDTVMGQSMESRGLKATLCPSVSAEYVYLVDSNGKVYFERNADTPAQIASITKIMTAIVAYENAPLDLQITVSSRAATVGESSAGLWAGDTLSLADALKALMIPSGNDAACAIAECVGAHMIGEEVPEVSLALGDSEEATAKRDRAQAAFVKKMNDKAAEIGCTDTVFENPHGLDFDQFAGNLHSTAKEVSLIAAYAMNIDDFKDIVDMAEATFAVNRSGENVDITVKTTDELLGKYEGSCGIKTGNTTLAGPCFAGACERDGITLYAIILKATTEAQRFVDATNLYSWVYNNHITYKLAHSDESIPMTRNGVTEEVPVVAEVALSGWLDKTVPATFADPNATVDIFALDGNVSQSFEFFEPGGGVGVGDVIGRATFFQANKEIASVDIVACESVAGPNIVEGIQIWWEKLMRAFSGQPDRAQSVIINDVELTVDKN